MRHSELLDNPLEVAVDELPRTASNKLIRRELRVLYAVSNGENDCCPVDSR